MVKKNNKNGRRQRINFITHNQAVSEIVGEVLMLLLVSASFGVLYYNVSSIAPPENPPNVTIVGRIDGNNLVFEHKRGDPLSLDTRITISMAGLNRSFVVRNYLDAEAKADGVWNIGESVVYPFPYNISNIRSYYQSYINTVDVGSNSMVFYATLDVYPESDLSITMTADNLHPYIGQQVNFTICITNPKDGAPAVNIQVQNLLSSNFSYYSNLSSSGEFNHNTGIWSIPSLLPGDTECLTITAVAVLTSTPTQMAMILDGSGSISASDWTLMKQGLANSIENASIFPHDGNVELTVIQFAGTKAQIELVPTKVTKTNYATIGASILNIHQMTGSTPMSCGIRLAADELRNVGLFNASKRQIITLVTDGVANVYWSSGYSGTYQGWDGWVIGDDLCHTGSYSAKSTSSRYGDFTCNNINTAGVGSVTVDFWYRLHGTTSTSFKLLFYDGSTYDSIASLGGGTKDVWLHYTKTTTDSQYYKSTFKIRFTTTGTGSVWIDDVRVTKNTNVVFNDSFESDYWAQNWWNLALKSAEDMQAYLVSKLQMTSDQDQFNVLGVGVGGMYGGPDSAWLKNKVVWPQPGHIAPPYIAGWVKTITSWQEFQNAMSEILGSYFGISNINNVEIISATPSTDPNPDNNGASIEIIPH
ncbi:MAG TPA: type IV pilin [Candidatus Thermoplasmatota archaeon]|nr:type IV pilin [Candidatus Thermoplasmatota archaeon]